MRGLSWELPGCAAPVSYLMTCAQCRRDVLDADQIGDEENASSAITSWPSIRTQSTRDARSVA